ncbi:MAG: tripartite tricarboxylate transporter TctB family protein [Beijerinckiaceae bacterium]
MTTAGRSSEWVTALLLATAGGGFAMLAARLPASTEPGTPGPGTAPMALGLILLACGLFIAARAGWHQPRDDAKPVAISHGAAKPLIGLALLAACAALLEPLGFTLSAFSFLIAGFILLGDTPWRIAVPAAAIGAVGLWLFFTKLLGVGLPYGLIEQILFR